MQAVLIFFLDCLAFAMAAIIAIVILHLIFTYLLPNKDQNDAKAVTAKRFNTLKSLNGPLMVYLTNDTKFPAHKVIDVLTGIQDGHEDFVIFVNTSGKKKYARFNTIDSIEELEEQTKK